MNIMKQKVNKCMICGANCSGKTVVKDIMLRDLNNNIIEWVLCSECFKLWTGSDYKNLTKRMKGVKDERGKNGY